MESVPTPFILQLSQYQPHSYSNLVSTNPTYTPIKSVQTVLIPQLSKYPPYSNPN